MNSIRLFVVFSLFIFLIISFVNATIEQKDQDDGTKQIIIQSPEQKKAEMEPKSKVNTTGDDFEDESYDSSVDDEKALFISDAGGDNDSLKADQDNSETKDEPTRSEEEYKTEPEKGSVDNKLHEPSSPKMENDIRPEINHPSASQQTVPVQTPPSWTEFLNFEELHEEYQKKQPFMIIKSKPYETYTYFSAAVQMKAIKLYKFYKKSIEGKKNFTQKIQNKISKLYKIKPDLNESHLNDKLLDELYHQLFKKNIYDFVFYGATWNNPLKAVCPGKTNQKIDIYLKKQTLQNSNHSDTVHQNENPSSPNIVSPTRGNLSPSRDQAKSPKTLSPSESSIQRWLSSGSKSQPTQQMIPLENYEKITYEGQVLRTHHTINVRYYYWPSLHLCETELEPAFIHKVNWKDTLGYEAGYLVEFKHKPEKPLNVIGDVMITPENTLWYHLAYFILNPTTTDTLYALHYIPFYPVLRERIRNLAVYTDYQVNKDVYPENMQFDHLYSEENQEEVFKNISEKKYKKYYNVKEGLVLEKQELIDQKSLPVWSYRRVTMYYMNIAPMYKIVREHSWSKVEEAILNMPITENETGNEDDRNTKTNNTGNESKSQNEEDKIEKNRNYAKYKYENPDKYLYEPVIRLASGTYGELQVEDQPVYLYHKKRPNNTTIKILRVPYAFYKLIEVEYTSPKVELINIPCHLTHHFTIVIITHNNPFEKKPKALCDEKISCKDYGWLNVDQENPKFGFTYCCKFTETLIKKLDIKEVTATIKSNRVLNLNTLKKIFKSKRSYYEDEVAPEDLIPKPKEKDDQQEA